jgi:hypothetical protein
LVNLKGRSVYKPPVEEEEVSEETTTIEVGSNANRFVEIETILGR